jgi:hypothetical protein
VVIDSAPRLTPLAPVAARRRWGGTVPAVFLLAASLAATLAARRWREPSWRPA